VDASWVASWVATPMGSDELMGALATAIFESAVP
jgi:hypothetical protein